MTPLFASTALDGRGILITGASSGIGAEVARFAAASGARVAIHGRDRPRLEQVLAGLAGSGHGVVVGDLVEGEAAEVVKGAVAAVGPLAGLVHAAGVHSAKPLRAIRASDFDATTRLNVTAGALLVKSLRMPAHRSAEVSIVYLSSVAGTTGQPGVSAYAASKGAVIALTRSLAVELAPERIRVNCVVPGMVPTPMSDGLLAKLSETQRKDVERQHLLGLGSVADVAGPVLFLLTDGARWMTGSVLTVDGGLTAQ